MREGKGAQDEIFIFIFTPTCADDLHWSLPGCWPDVSSLHGTSLQSMFVCESYGEVLLWFRFGFKKKGQGNFFDFQKSPRAQRAGNGRCVQARSTGNHKIKHVQEGAAQSEMDFMTWHSTYIACFIVNFLLFQDLGCYSAHPVKSSCLCHALLQRAKVKLCTLREPYRA